MSPLILLGAGGGIVIVLGIWTLLRRSRDGQDGPDLGTISGQWIAERRVHERESADR